MAFGRFDRQRFRWPGARVPFVIDQTAFPPGSPGDTAIRGAINEWNTKTVIFFDDRGPADVDYVSIEPADIYCQSESLGRQGGKQVVACGLPVSVVAPPGARITIALQEENLIVGAFVGSSGGLWVNRPGFAGGCFV